MSSLRGLGAPRVKSSARPLYPLAVGALGSGLPLQFSSASGALAPTIVDSAIPGVIAVAWLKNIPSAIGGRSLRYIQMPKTDNQVGLQVYGVEANDADGHSVRLKILGLPLADPQTSK